MHNQPSISVRLEGWTKSCYTEEENKNHLMSHPAPACQPELTACLLQVGGVQAADGRQEAARNERTLHKHQFEDILECVQ